jgi:dUTP pyrophosphatase
METVYFAKVRLDVILPTKREEDGCYDLYANFSKDSIIIPPHSTKLISTGFATAFPSTLRISLRERGSNTKFGCKVSAGQIDSGFRNEYFVALTNILDKPVEITKSINDVEITDEFIRYPYSKAICQFAIEYVPQVNVEEIPYDELKEIPSLRGLGMLGSSGK